MCLTEMEGHGPKKKEKKWPCFFLEPWFCVPCWGGAKQEVVLFFHHFALWGPFPPKKAFFLGGGLAAAHTGVAGAEWVLAVIATPPPKIFTKKMFCIIRKKSRWADILSWKGSGPTKLWQPQTRQDSAPFTFPPPGNRAIFSTFWGDFLTNLHIKPGEREQKSTGQNSENPVERFPRNCRFLSLVVVERVLKGLGGLFPVFPRQLTMLPNLKWFGTF